MNIHEYVRKNYYVLDPFFGEIDGGRGEEELILVREHLERYRTLELYDFWVEMNNM